jgi:molecular chaperone GrpE
MNDEQTASPAGDDNNAPTTANPATPANGTPATNNDPDYTALQNELEETKNKLDDLTRISQHALADLQNFKKRSEEEKAKFIVFANSLLITELLPVLDNIDRAIAHIPEDPAAGDSRRAAIIDPAAGDSRRAAIIDAAAKEWANGILAVLKQLQDVLKKQGLEVIPTDGQIFNPNFHEAVMMETGPQDQITRELEKGYKIQDRIIRRAKVVVGNSEAENKPSAEGK